METTIWGLGFLLPFCLSALPVSLVQIMVVCVCKGRISKRLKVQWLHVRSIWSSFSTLNATAMQLHAVHGKGKWFEVSKTEGNALQGD